MDVESVVLGAGTLVHSFKFAADFESPLEHVLAMSREFDLTHTWNRYVTESIILAEPSIFENTVYAASWLPFPFPHIDVVVSARGIDLADVSFWDALVAAGDHGLCLACCANLLCATLCCAVLRCAVHCCVVCAVLCFAFFSWVVSRHMLLGRLFSLAYPVLPSDNLLLFRWGYFVRQAHSALILNLIWHCMQKRPHIKLYHVPLHDAPKQPSALGA